MRYAIAGLLALAVSVAVAVQPAEANHPGTSSDNIHLAVASAGEDYALHEVSSRSRTRVRIDDRGDRSRVRIDDRGDRSRVRIDDRGDRTRVRIDERGRVRVRDRRRFGHPPVHHFHHPHSGLRIHVPGVTIGVGF